MIAPPTQRPLAELGPMERRRNSPSYNQATKVSYRCPFQRAANSLLTWPQKNIFDKESSPFESSPFPSASPKSYWKNRDLGSPTRFNAENRSPADGQEHPTSAVKRSSIENLKRASRVKNSNMFAREHKQEYDPASSPLIERPLASGRPLATAVQGNAYGGQGLNGAGIKKGLNQSPLRSPAKMKDLFESNAPQIKAQTSPSKSSMSSKSRYANANSFDPESSIWTDEEDSIADRQLPPGKTLHRHAKSVTFDAAPPQVNEYEMTTPDPSSVASGSRDGSHDSEEDDDEDESFDRSSIDRDDSFDASLEDTEKTPVVLPEDWRFMSPALANEDLASKIEDPFDLEACSPSPNVKARSAVDARMTPTRTDSATSDAERRPLPPLPPSTTKAETTRERSNSATNRSTALERAMHTPRKEVSPPRPASLSKAELQGMGGLAMPLEERLRLMMVQDNESPKSVAEEQRERRLRRSSPLRETQSQDNESAIESNATDADEDMADLDDFKLPPRISRDSILRKVKDRAQQAKSEEDNSSAMLSPQHDQSSIQNIDPDQPLPTTETEGADEDVQIKPESADDDSELDVYSIPELYNSHLEAQSFVDAMQKLEVIEKSQAVDEASDVDDESHYSDESKIDDFHPEILSRTANDDGPPTPRPKSALNHNFELGRKNSQRMSLPQFAALLGEQDFGLGMESFLTPSPHLDTEPVKQQHHDVKHSWSSLPSSNSQEGDGSTVATAGTGFGEFMHRPVTPEEQLLPPRFSAQGDHGDEEPKTPDSVIRHPVEESPVPESQVIPELVATIKSSGSKLKTRPSATPADIRTMAETRRQVSGEVPDIPQIPAKHLGRPSVVAEGDEIENEEDGLYHDKNTEDHETLRQAKRKSSLIPLDIPVEETGGLGFGIETEFDRVIEAQKVRLNLPNASKTFRTPIVLILEILRTGSSTKPSGEC